jgi:1,4-dihydroxy-2-naphthoate octaprenyltransferase
MKVWIEAARPKTLIAAVAPILVGTSLAAAQGHALRWHLSVFALLSALFIQIATNLFNDAIDFKKGTDNEERVGPRRITQSGLLSPKAVMAGAFVACAIAALFAIPLLLQGGAVILGIGLVSLFFAYAYTGGPFPLAYLGLGEIFVILFFGFTAVMGVYFLQTDQFDRVAALAGLQIGLLATVLLAINNLRDVEGDRKTQKNTLAVRFGQSFGRWEIAFLCFAPFVLGFAWFEFGHRWAALLPLVCLPRAILVTRGVFKNSPGPVYNAFLGQGAQLQLAFGVLMSIGLYYR